MDETLQALDRAGGRALAGGVAKDALAKLAQGRCQVVDGDDADSLGPMRMLPGRRNSSQITPCPECGVTGDAMFTARDEMTAKLDVIANPTCGWKGSRRA